MSDHESYDPEAARAMGRNFTLLMSWALELPAVPVLAAIYGFLWWLGRSQVQLSASRFVWALVILWLVTRPVEIHLAQRSPTLAKWGATVIARVFCGAAAFFLVTRGMWTGALVGAIGGLVLAAGFLAWERPWEPNPPDLAEKAEQFRREIRKDWGLDD